MTTRNITLSLPVDLLKKAKIVAAKAEKSLSELFKEALEVRIKKDSGYQRARTRQLKLLRAGLNLGTKGKIQVKRDDLYER